MVTHHGVVMRHRYAWTGLIHRIHEARERTILGSPNVVRMFTETPAQTTQKGNKRKRSRRKYALRPSDKDRIRSLVDAPSKPMIAHAAKAAGFVQERLEEAQKMLFSLWGQNRPVRKGPEMNWWWWTWNIAFGLSPSIVIIILMETWGRPHADEKLKIIEEREKKKEELLIEEAMKQVPPKLPPLIIEDGKTPPAEVLIERINDLEARLDLFSRKRVEEWRDSQLSGIKKRIKEKETLAGIQEKMDTAEKGKEGTTTDDNKSEIGGVWKVVATTLGFENEEKFFEYAIQASPFDRSSPFERSPSVLKQKGTSEAAGKPTDGRSTSSQAAVERAQAAAEEAQKHAITAEAHAAEAREQANKNMSWTSYFSGGSSVNDSALLAVRVADQQAAIAREMAVKAQEQAKQAMSQQGPHLVRDGHQHDGSLQTDASIARQRSDDAPDAVQRKLEGEESKEARGGHWSRSWIRIFRGGNKADDSSNTSPAPPEPA